MAVYRRRREELEGHLNRGALWAVTYGDLMSFLMVLFLILFSFSVAKTTAQGGDYEESILRIQQAFGAKLGSEALARISNKRRMETLPGKLQAVVAEQKLSGQVEIVSTEGRIRLILAAPVLFDLGKSELKPEAEPILASLIGPLNELDNDIVVEGHTDTLPVVGRLYKDNLELSLSRAYSVVDFLKTQGASPARLSAAGFGEHKPVAPNDMPQGRAQNRRIEISLVKR